MICWAPVSQPGCAGGVSVAVRWAGIVQLTWVGAGSIAAGGVFCRAVVCQVPWAAQAGVERDARGTEVCRAMWRYRRSLAAATLRWLSCLDRRSTVCRDSGAAGAERAPVVS